MLWLFQLCSGTEQRCGAAGGNQEAGQHSAFGKVCADLNAYFPVYTMHPTYVYIRHLK